MEVVLTSSVIAALKYRYLVASTIATAIGDAAVHITLSHMLSGVVRYSFSLLLGFLIRAIPQIFHARDIHDLSRSWLVVLECAGLSTVIGTLIYLVFRFS